MYRIITQGKNQNIYLFINTYFNICNFTMITYWSLTSLGTFGAFCCITSSICTKDIKNINIYIHMYTKQITFISFYALFQRSRFFSYFDLINDTDNNALTKIAHNLIYLPTHGLLSKIIIID